jgi:hypothetical protein
LHVAPTADLGLGPLMAHMEVEPGMLGRNDIYLEFTAGHADRVKTYLAAKPKDRHGAHRYSFDDLGLDMDTVRAAFRNYQQTYGVEDES